ncbi:MAG: tetratricopeptide repeat protein [Myxococcales bacterium]|nr:tetratricopeptide repeat protein [Myxococcales bacterium]
MWRLQLPAILQNRRGRSRTSSRREFDALLHEALFAILDEDPETAERALADAVRVDSSNVDAYLALCRFYRGRGEIGRAIRLHQNLLLRKDLDGQERARVLLELGQDFNAGGFLRRAVASFEEVLVHESRHPVALRALVELLADLQEFPRSIALERRLAKLEQRDRTREASLLLRMGEYEREEGRAGAARKAVKTALRRDPRCAAAYILLGQLEADRGRDKAALVAWKKVPALDRRAAMDLYGKVEAAFAATNRARDFEGFLRTLVEENPADSEATLALARYLSSRGDADLASVELKRLLGRDPGNLAARIVLGRCLLATGREAEVVSEFASLLDLLDETPRRGEYKGLE